MLDLRKFPLLHALFPFLIGLVSCYSLNWTVFNTLFFVLLTSILAFFTFGKRHSIIPPIWGRLICFHFLWFAFGSVLFSVNDFRFFKDTIHTKLNTEVVLSGEIVEVKKGIGGKQQLVVETNSIIQADSSASCSGKIIVFAQDDLRTFSCGDLIIVGGKLLSISDLNNPGEFKSVAFYQSRKVSGILFSQSEVIQKTGKRTSMNSLLTSWRDFLAEQMEKELSGTFLGISKALILGDKSDLDQETMNAFSTTGSMHVLAVSGLHIGLILLLFQRIIGLFSRWISKRQGIILAIVLIWVYGGITGASPAVMRAVVMFTILSGSQVFRRQHHPLNVLGFSAIGLLCFDPWMLFDLGFQLSYAAMFGIFLLYKPIIDAWIPSNKWVRKGWEGTAVGFAATIVTTPLILYHFHQFPNYFALANLGVMVFGSAVLMLGMVFLFTVWIPYLVKLVALVFAFSIFGLVYWVNWVDSLSGAVSGGFQLAGWEVISAYVLVFGWIIYVHKRPFKRIWLTLATGLLISFWSYERFHVLESREFVIFNSNQFVAAVKIKNEVYGVYDRKWNGSWKVPRELEAYAKFTGSQLHIVRLYHAQTWLKVNSEEWAFSKKYEGVEIKHAKGKLFYRTGGIPDMLEQPSLMTTRLQQYANPERATKPFQLVY